MPKTRCTGAEPLQTLQRDSLRPELTLALPVFIGLFTPVPSPISLPPSLPEGPVSGRASGALYGRGVNGRLFPLRRGVLLSHRGRDRRLPGGSTSATGVR